MINISFSGGLGSAVTALIAHKKEIPARLIFADTLIEDEDLYRFLKEIVEKTSLPFIWLKDGRTPWDVFEDKKYIGNSRIAQCSKILKTDQVRAWLKENSPETEPLVLGMDYGELDRLERAAKLWAPRPIISLLNEYKVYRPDYDKWLEEYKIAKPKLYEYGFPHNNCGGMCVRAGLKQFATLLETMPERYEVHEKRMEEAVAKIGKTAKPFLRHNVDGKRVYLTMKQFREGYQSGEIKVNPFDYGGCGCFIDEEDK